MVVDRMLSRIGLSDESALALVQLAIDTTAKYEVLRKSPVVCDLVKEKKHAVTNAQLASALNDYENAKR